ncbi:MAG: methyltransferase [Vicingaceae bacterium]
MSPKSKPFRFKQFDVYQEQTAMKVGTDGVLLGAWTEVENAQSILDVGCGTGLLSLMLAQKSAAKITALEIDPKAIKEAVYNVSLSPWSKQIELIEADFKDFQSEHRFDLIICNPPFFKGKKEDTSRSLARQNTYLPYDILFSKATDLLNENGVFSLITPFGDQEDILKLANFFQLNANKIVNVKGHAYAPYKRTLFRFRKSKQNTKSIVGEITIEAERNQFTEEYTELLKPYLLYL